MCFQNTDYVKSVLKENSRLNVFALRHLKKLLQPLTSRSVLLLCSVTLRLQNHTEQDVMEYSVIKARLQCGGDSEKGTRRSLQKGKAS